MSRDEPTLVEESPELRTPSTTQRGLPPHQLQLGDRVLYFFKQDRYVRYRVATEFRPDGTPAPFEAVDVGPARIADFWTHLHPFFHSDVDAVVNWGNGKAYFFKRDHYVRYDIATDLVDVGPAPISQFWTHLHPFFHTDIDTVVNWGDGKAYFFKQDRYVRYDIATDLVDVGPAPISQFWTHLHPSFHRDIGAVLNWTAPMDLAGYLRSAGLVVNEIGDWRARVRPGGGDFTPVGVVMHHTAATNSLQDIVKGRPEPKGGFLHGPLANFHVPKSGVVNLVSATIAQHAGTGSRRVLSEVTHDVAPTGTANKRGLKNDIGGNTLFYGFENENLGNGRDQWPIAQLETMVEAAAALCRAHGWSAARVIGHKEWLNGKIDPALDMDTLRGLVRGKLD